ncbi:hypothetical protein BDZ89DRAFT_1141571 [Hymenopellis radicata]|nr:hypothetical protein BDZ89DRAFT_1141571 [Hymenopellis radicata]
MLTVLEKNAALAEKLRAIPIPKDCEYMDDAKLGRSYAYQLKADQLLRQKKFREAREHYVEGATTLCGTIPYREKYFCDTYLGLKNLERSIVATTCCVGAARCMYELGDYVESLQWVSQVNVLQRHAQASTMDDTFEWMDCQVNVPEYYRVRLLATAVGADIYVKLGNTGAAVENHWTATCTRGIIPPRLQDEALKGIPKEAPGTPVESISNIRGSWKKLNSRGLSSRMGCGIFVYNGYLYAFGGEKALEGPFFPELWRIQLRSLGGSVGDWQPLPSYPFASLTMNYTGFPMALNRKDNKAYLFVGTQDMRYFDVQKEQWGLLRTTYQGKWPYDLDTKNSVLHCIDGKLYVFGGVNASSPIGTDLLMVLDIKAKEWRLLSGTAIPDKPSYFSPGPREHACSWVGKGGKKIYIMYGDADRMAAKMAGTPHGSMTTYDYDDLWCWDIEKETWTKQRIIGNQPSKRTEMACVYNPVLDKVITFGGYSPRVPTESPQTNEVFTFSYYADTFMLDSDDPSISSWRHVLTRGFPIYRAQGQLFVDETTGKTYLFSGYTNSEFVPGQKHLVSRSFSDIWQLRLDMAGGFFEAVDVDGEALTAKAGPWKRCFACGSAGMWQKCGGSCNGKAYFCNAQCLKESWKAYKEAFNCRKV